MKLQKFSGRWCRSEDRISFTIFTDNFSEYKFWMTRYNLSELFLKSNYLPSSKKKPPLENQAKRNSVVKSDVNYPFGVDAVLIKDIICESKENAVVLKLILENHKTFHLDLALEVFNKLLDFLNQLQIKANWKVSNNIPLDIQSDVYLLKVDGTLH